MMVCLTDAVCVNGRGLRPNDLVELPRPESRATPEQIEALFLSRRSIRHFQDTPVSPELLDRVIAAGDGKVLLPKWPVGLRGHECDAARDSFDHARDAVVKDVQAMHEVSSESQDQLMRAVNGLFVALDAAYPHNVLEDSSKFKEYRVAKGFVTSLLAAANRAIDINDPSVFSGGLRFQGDSLFALVEHMHRNGLQFAPPEPGGEGIYRTVFTNLRHMYVDLAREQPAANGQ